MVWYGNNNSNQRLMNFTMCERGNVLKIFFCYFDTTCNSYTLRNFQDIRTGVFDNWNIWNSCMCICKLTTEKISSEMKRRT